MGTTVVRALETAEITDSISKVNVKPRHDYTRLHIDANNRLKAVDGLRIKT